MRPLSMIIYYSHIADKRRAAGPLEALSPCPSAPPRPLRPPTRVTTLQHTRLCTTWVSYDPSAHQAVHHMGELLPISPPGCAPHGWTMTLQPTRLCTTWVNYDHSLRNAYLRTGEICAVDIQTSIFRWYIFSGQHFSLNPYQQSVNIGSRYYIHDTFNCINSTHSTRIPQWRDSRSINENSYCVSFVYPLQEGLGHHRVSQDLVNPMPQQSLL